MNTVKQYRQNGFKVWVTHHRPTVDGEVIQYSRKTKSDVDMKPNGGYTTVILRNPNGVEVSATSKCSDLDTFNYSVGTNIALGRARKKLVYGS